MSLIKHPMTAKQSIICRLKVKQKYKLILIES